MCTVQIDVHFRQKYSQSMTFFLEFITLDIYQFIYVPLHLLSFRAKLKVASMFWVK